MKSKNIKLSLTQHTLRERMWAALVNNHCELREVLSILNQWSLSGVVRHAVNRNLPPKVCSPFPTRLTKGNR